MPAPKDFIGPFSDIVPEFERGGGSEGGAVDGCGGTAMHDALFAHGTEVSQSATVVSLGNFHGKSSSLVFLVG